MVTTVGPYTFTHAKYDRQRDELALWNHPAGLAVMDHETDQGDRWFTPADSREVTGLEIESATGRIALGNPLTVELPSGETATVRGADALLADQAALRQ